MDKGLNREGVIHLWDKIKAKFVAKETGKGLSTNDYTTAEKTKLAGLNNYTHPTYEAKSSGLYKITVDSKGHVSGATTVIKSDITGLGIPTQDTTYTTVTTSLDGLMSKADKVKLDAIESGANKYVHPSHTSKANGLYKVTVDSEGHVSSTSSVTKSDITELGIPSQDTTYTNATTSEAGLMSTSDKAKLDAFGDASTYALKSDIVSVYKYKGSVNTAAELPTNALQGDVYNIASASSYGGAGMNVVFTGTTWDALGEAFTFETITSETIDSICI